VSKQKELRDQLAAELRDALDVTVFSSWPTDIVLPCIYVMPPLGDAYIQAGPNFQEFTLATDVAILVDHADVVESLEALETLIEGALVNSMDWALTSVEPPAPITVTEGGAEYLGTVLHLSKPFHL
jgi:hypothetical protein